MPKTPKSKRLIILAYPSVSEWPELAELETKGHTVLRGVLPDSAEEYADLILGPKCWRMDEPLRKYLKNAVKAAQRTPKIKEIIEPNGQG